MQRYNSSMQNKDLRLQFEDGQEQDVSLNTESIIFFLHGDNLILPGINGSPYDTIWQPGGNFYYSIQFLHL